MANRTIFRSARIFDGESEILRQGLDVLVADGCIEQVSEHPLSNDDGTMVVDCGGRVLMPGCIDAHVHVYGYGLNVTRVVQAPATYVAHFAAQFLQSSLDRGLLLFGMWVGLM